MSESGNQTKPHRDTSKQATTKPSPANIPRLVQYIGCYDLSTCRPAKPCHYRQGSHRVANTGKATPQNRHNGNYTTESEPTYIINYKRATALLETAPSLYGLGCSRWRGILPVELWHFCLIIRQLHRHNLLIIKARSNQIERPCRNCRTDAV